MTSSIATELYFPKRPGTGGLLGHLYESKLTSTIFYRLKQKKNNVEQFYLATNVDKIGALDDIFFKAIVNGFSSPVFVYIQAKHTEKLAFNYKTDLLKYFNSYLSIRDQFNASNKHELFKGIFEETMCFFVFYTIPKDHFKDDKFEHPFAEKLNDLIGTGGTVKQPYSTEKDVEFLSNAAVKKDVIKLAGLMAKFIFGKGDFQMLLSLEPVAHYHVILTQKVIDVSEIKPGGHRIASFRQDFFDDDEELLIVLKNTLYMEVLKKRELKETEIQNLLSDFLSQPNEVEILSKLIGTVITYNNGRLEPVTEKLTEDAKRQLNQLCISQSTANEAVKIAAKEILSPRQFKVPIAFGNRDLSLNGSEAKIQRTLSRLTSTISNLLNKSEESNKIVTIDESDESLDHGLLLGKWGIVGAVGNMLLLDEHNKKLMKFTDNGESLGDLSRRLFRMLECSVPNLHEYKFNLKVKNCPKFSFDCSEYEKSLARDFLKNLIFYSDQADEAEVERLLKDEIDENQPNPMNHFQIKTDAMFQNYHKKIQIWSMLPNQTLYLTKESDIFEESIKNIVVDPLMSVINMIYVNKIKHNYTFNEDAVMSLGLQDSHLRITTIVTESSALTVAKVMQYLKNKQYVVLDLEYILSLPVNERSALCKELTNAEDEKILVFVCEIIQNSRSGNKTLESIANAAHSKTTIVVTNETSVAIANKYFSSSDNTVRDKRNRLIDFTKESQESILNNGRMSFQCEEVSLDLFRDDEAMTFVEGDVLNSIISEETIVVGQSLGNSKYDKMKHLYVDRRVTSQTKDLVLKTFYDTEEHIVLITAVPGAGKSTLLTHLSVNTKKLDPNIWILKINLLEYSRELNVWKEAKTNIDLLETLNFLCQVILQQKLGKDNEVKITLEQANDLVYLKDCSGNQRIVFELKLLLHFYKRGKLILIFDGFDEICPDYIDEVVECLKTVSKYPRKHRMWVASRSYLKFVLEREFGESYKIENFSFREQKEYMEKIWKSNLILKEFNNAQLQNVYDFIKFITKSISHELPLTFSEYPLYNIVYISALEHLINEIKYVVRKNIKKEVLDLVHGTECRLREYYINPRNDYPGIPLHLYLTADYFQNKMKDVTANNEWNVSCNIFTIYDNFVETKLKKILFEEKNDMDIYRPDIINYYKWKRAEFLMKHKKIAAYISFDSDKHKLFDEEQLKEIDDMIQLVKTDGDGTDFISELISNIPLLYIHMTFIEYFTVAYICDLFKNEHLNTEQRMRDVLYVVFSRAEMVGVRAFLDSKLGMDETLKHVIHNNSKVIFDLLMEQGKHFSQSENSEDSTFFCGITEYLPNVMGLSRSAIEMHLNVNNLENFINLFGNKLVLSSIICNNFFCNKEIKKNERIELILFLLDIVRKIDKSKLRLLCVDDDDVVTDSKVYENMNNVEILECLLTKLFGPCSAT